VQIQPNLWTQFFNDWQHECGRRLQAKRQFWFKTQADLAQAAGVSQSMISYAELGVREPRLAQKMLICAALSCEVEDIWPYPDRVTFAKRVQGIAA